jgi:GDP-L-fucose synthase
MLRLLPQVKVCFVFGSGSEYGCHQSIDNVHSSELGDVMPRDPYGISKAIISLDARNHPKVINLRLFNCFGVGEAKDRFISATITNVLYGFPVQVHQDREFDFFWVEDLANVVSHYVSEAVEGCLSRLPCEINCVYERKLLLTEVAQCIARTTTRADCVIHTSEIGLCYTGSGEIPWNVELLGLEQGVMSMVAVNNESR